MPLNPTNPQTMLGLESTAPLPGPVMGGLPVFLRSHFDLEQVCIAEQPVVLAKPKIDQRLLETRRQLVLISERLKMPVVFCPPSLAPYERRNLILQGVPFIVPGQQVYLPSLGIDLRGRRPVAYEAPNVLSPATQVLLIWSLLHTPAPDEWLPGPVAAALGYTPMTVSRAIRELSSAGLMSVEQHGRLKYLKKNETPQEIWQKAQPFLRSPVFKTIWLATEDLARLDPRHVRLSGYSALATLTDLADTAERHLAIPKKQWLRRDPAIVPLEGWAPGAISIDIWLYETAIYAEHKTVDPLSLWISLRQEPDARVQAALAQLMDGIAW